MAKSKYDKDLENLLSEGKIFTVEETAKLLCMSSRHLRNEMVSHNLPYYRFGARGIRITEKQIKEYIQNSKTQYSSIRTKIMQEVIRYLAVGAKWEIREEVTDDDTLAKLTVELVIEDKDVITKHKAKEADKAAKEVLKKLNRKD